jgi:protein TonB
VATSLLAHAGLITALLLLGAVPTPRWEGATLPLELVAPDRMGDGGSVLPPLPPVALPTTIVVGESGAARLAAMAERWPAVPVRVRPPRAAAQATVQMRAPDAPPPIPAMEGYDLESSLRRVDRPDRATAPAAALADNPPAPYPADAKRLGLQGTAVVRVTVTVDGRPTALRLVESSGWSALDDAALAALGDWRFRPAMRGGQAVEATIDLPVVFSLEGG